MEQETNVELFQPQASNALVTLTEQQNEFVYQIFANIIQGQYDNALKMLNTNGSDDPMLPELYKSVLKRIVLRLQAPDSPKICLQEVLMNAHHLGEDIPEETVQELYMSAQKYAYETLVEELKANINYMKLILEYTIKESSKIEFRKKTEILMLIYGLAFFIILLVWYNSYNMCD